MREQVDDVEWTPSPRAEGLPSPVHRPGILLAEDDDEVRWALTALFLNLGYDVRAVADGGQLLRELEAAILHERGRKPPDVIVTDVRMPGLNAINVMASLRDAGWTTPMLVISAFGDSTLRERVHHLGDATFFDKPLNLPALEAAVSAAAHLTLDGERR